MSFYPLNLIMHSLITLIPGVLCVSFVVSLPQNDGRKPIDVAKTEVSSLFLALNPHVMSYLPSTDVDLFFSFYALAFICMFVCSSQAIKNLLRNAAPVDKKMGNNALHTAAKDGNANNALHTAAKDGNLAGVRSQAGNIDINAKGEFGSTALGKAAHEGHTEIVKLLLTLNADVNLANVSTPAIVVHLPLSFPLPLPLSTSHQPCILSYMSMLLLLLLSMLLLLSFPTAMGQKPVMVGGR